MDTQNIGSDLSWNDQIRNLLEAFRKKTRLSRMQFNMVLYIAALGFIFIGATNLNLNYIFFIIPLLALFYPVVWAALNWNRPYYLWMLISLGITWFGTILFREPENIPLWFSSGIGLMIIYLSLRAVNDGRGHWIQTEESLLAREAHYRSVIEGLPEGVLILDRDGRVQICNKSAEDIFALTRDRMLTVKVTDLPITLLSQDGTTLHADQRPSLDALKTGAVVDGVIIGLKKRDGKIAWLTESVHPLVCEGKTEPEGVVLVFSDITEQARYEERLRNLSNHDRLTGLHNRIFFEEEIEHLDRASRRPVSFLVADIDNLKITNDTYGHGAGDELIQQAATVLKASFRANDLIARIGGDEFAVILPDVDEPVTRIGLRRVLDQLETHNRARGGQALSISFGVATAPDGVSLGEALKIADQRMYDDKLSHKRAAQSGTP